VASDCGVGYVILNDEESDFYHVHVSWISSFCYCYCSVMIWTSLIASAISHERAKKDENLVVLLLEQLQWLLEA